MANNENESYEVAYTKFNLTLIYNNTHKNGHADD